MKSRFKVGDRVIDDYLGAGEVIKVLYKILSSQRAYEILFDDTPPVKFNLGKNPCMSFEWNLEYEK